MPAELLEIVSLKIMNMDGLPSLKDHLPEPIIVPVLLYLTNAYADDYYFWLYQEISKSF